jgi:hypothetical protein
LCLPALTHFDLLWFLPASEPVDLLLWVAKSRFQEHCAFKSQFQAVVTLDFQLLNLLFDNHASRLATFISLEADEYKL